MMWRRHYRYWLRDPLVGARLIATHQGLRALPTDAASAVGGALGRYAGPRLHAAADARARAALQALRPDLAATGPMLDAAAGRVWDGIGRTYAEFSAEDRLWPEGRVQVEGRDHVLALKRSGRPLIVAGVHLGNWELLPIALGYLGVPMADVYQPQRNRFEDRIAMRTRLRTAKRIIDTVPEAVGLAPEEAFKLLPPSPSAGAELVRTLRAGRAVMMFVDESVGGRVGAPRFGRAARTDGNLGRVIRLARMAGAAIVPAFVVRTGGARFTARFLPPIEAQATADRDADLLANVSALDAALSGPVLEHLDQWFMLLDFRMDR